MTHSAGEAGDAQVGDGPDLMARGRSENPPPDGMGYDGCPVDQI